MDPMTRSASAIGGVLLLAALTSCTGPTADPASSGDTEARSVTAPTTSDRVPNLATPVDDLPFTQYREAVMALDRTSASDGVSESIFASREAFIADCMAAEGFTYTPTEFAEPESMSYLWLESSVAVPDLPANRAEVQEYGYGQDDIERSERELSQGSALDANGEYIESLNAAAVTEYVYALTGARGPDDLDPADDGGCGGRATAQFPTTADTSDAAMDQFSPLIVAMQTMVRREIYADPSVVALNDEWTGCMAGAGYDVSAPSGYPDPSVPGPMEAWGLAVITGSDGEVHWPAVGTATKDIPEDERYLVGSAAEHAVALADFDCRVESDYIPRFAAALHAVESEFVDQRSDELAAMVAAARLS